MSTSRYLNYLAPNNWNMTKRAIIEINSTNTKIITVPISILEADEGLRPNAFMVAYPIAAITAEGPNTTIAMIRSMTAVFIIH